MAEAIRWARDYTGIPSTGFDYQAENAARQAERDRKARESAAEDAKDAARRIAYARRLWAASSPVAGTAAERYLVDARHIPVPTVWPDAVRFHEPTCALIVAATLADGTVQAVQRIRLTPEGTKAEATPERPVKITNGVLAKAAVRLPGDPAACLLLAEGPETGLSVWSTTGHETLIALGGMAGVPLPEGRRIVTCRDDDPKHSPADRQTAKAVAAWRTFGHRVAVASPWPFRLYDKTDFNDTLKQNGADGVRRRIEAALNPEGGPPIRRPIKWVREKLRDAVAGFYDATRAWNANQVATPPEFAPEPDALIGAGDWDALLDQPAPESPAPLPVPVHAIKVDVGSGKTLATILGAIRMLGEMRAAGDNRSAALAIPTHALADELAATFALHARGTGLTAAVWRGMSATDPDSPRHPMCRNLEAVQDARDAMLEVFRTTCRRKLENGDVVMCPFFSKCGYQRQRESQADVWIVAHDLLFMEKPGTIGKLAFLVVDEAVWQDGLEGIHGKPTALSLDSLAHMEPLPLGASMTQRLDQQRLQYLRDRLLDRLRPSADGPVSAEAIDRSDLTVENTREAYGLEWARFVDPGMHPGMTKTERRAAVQRAAINATIPRLASVWKAMTALLEDGGPQRSGWAALAVRMAEDGLQRVLHLKGRKTVRKGWQVPTLLIDATMSVDLTRPYWPDLELTAELLADAPHQHIWQVVDRTYSKSAIEPLTEDMPGYSPKEARRRHRGLRNLHATVNREARAHGGAPVLLVTQKAVEEALPGHGPMASCIDLAHHNAVAGRDQWRNVRALIVVGRTQPTPASVERMAEALTGRAVDGLEGWYQRGDGVRHMAEAGAVGIEADRHPDPICEAIRWQVCEGELVQIIGRGRGVNRTEADPLDVLVLTDTPLPTPVTATMQAADLAPSPDDLMLAAGGVVLENAADAAATYPHLWATRNAAKFALYRWRTEAASSGPDGIKLLKKSTYRGLIPSDPELSRIAYQRAGARMSPAIAWYDPELAPDPAEWLTRRLGPLAWCHTGRDPDPPLSLSARQDKPRPQPSDLSADVTADAELAQAEAPLGPLPDAPPDMEGASWVPDWQNGVPELEHAGEPPDIVATTRACRASSAAPLARASAARDAQNGDAGHKAGEDWRISRGEVLRRGMAADGTECRATRDAGYVQGGDGLAGRTDGGGCEPLASPARIH